VGGREGVDGDRGRNRLAGKVVGLVESLDRIGGGPRGALGGAVADGEERALSEEEVELGFTMGEALLDGDAELLEEAEGALEGEAAYLEGGEEENARRANATRGGEGEKAEGWQGAASAADAAVAERRTRQWGI
jgi:hypothetical protein